MTPRRLPSRKADADLIAARQKAVADELEDQRGQSATGRNRGRRRHGAWPNIRQAQANERTAQLDLSYTKIFAPCDGRVTRKAVEPGDYMQVGQTLMSLVPTDVWVVANFKESQLKKMKPGQPARWRLMRWVAGRSARHVDSIQAGSGAAFSLLPPENATGNYVKVVQRVPVKILFDEPLPADHTDWPRSFRDAERAA